MAVKFIVDSALDLTPAECEALGVTCLPLTVLFGSEEYADGVTLTADAFYDKLTTNPNHPTTSQVTPAAFEEAYARATANGNQAVVITLSSRLSGTYQSAVIAAEDYEGRVFPVDSMNATAGEQILLRRGLELAQEGRSAEEVVEILNREKEEIRVYAIVDTLEYLRKGGRISAATAVVGGLLNIKPAVALQNGLVESVGKARGAKAANALLRQMVEQGGPVDAQRPVCLMYSGKTDENLRKFLEESGELLPAGYSVSCMGSVVGTHVGPGAVAVAYFRKS